MPAVTPYRATVYRRRSAGTGPGRQQLRAWDEVAGAAELSCDRQVASVALRKEPFGEMSESRHLAWFETGLDIRVGDGVCYVKREDATGSLIAITPPESFVVKQREDWGPPGDLELELEETSETFTSS